MRRALLSAFRAQPFVSSILGGRAPRAAPPRRGNRSGGSVSRLAGACVVPHGTCGGSRLVVSFRLLQATARHPARSRNRAVGRLRPTHLPSGRCLRREIGFRRTSFVSTSVPVSPRRRPASGGLRMAPMPGAVRRARNALGAGCPGFASVPFRSGPLREREAAVRREGIDASCRAAARYRFRRDAIQ